MWQTLDPSIVTIVQKKKKMGGGVSVPAEMKPMIHTQFDIQATEDWKNGRDLESIDELRAELVRLRHVSTFQEKKYKMFCCSSWLWPAP